MYKLEKLQLTVLYYEKAVQAPNIHKTTSFQISVADRYTEHDMQGLWQEETQI